MLNINLLSSLVVSVALSRNPVKDVIDINLVEEVETYVNSIESCLPVSDEKLQQIRQASADDETRIVAKQLILHGWPDYEQNVPLVAKKLFGDRINHTTHNGLIIFGQRFVEPQCMQSEIRVKIHHDHQGVYKCL